MVSTNINKCLGEESFKYGNHIIKISVLLTYESIRDGFNIVPQRRPYSTFCRNVRVMAYRKEEEDYDIMNSTTVDMNAEKKVNKYIFFGPEVIKNEIPEIEFQIRRTAKPVFKKLDELYSMTQEAEIDIEVATTEVSVEKSWVEIEDEVERLSEEIQELATQ